MNKYILSLPIDGLRYINFNKMWSLKLPCLVVHPFVHPSSYSIYYPPLRWVAEWLVYSSCFLDVRFTWKTTYTPGRIPQRLVARPSTSSETPQSPHYIRKYENMYVLRWVRGRNDFLDGWVTADQGSHPWFHVGEYTIAIYIPTAEQYVCAVHIGCLLYFYTAHRMHVEHKLRIRCTFPA